MKQPIPHAILARRYFDWCKRQLELAEEARNPRIRNEHLALAQFYFKLADCEAAASQGTNAASRPSGDGNVPVLLSSGMEPIATSSN